MFDPTWIDCPSESAHRLELNSIVLVFSSPGDGEKFGEAVNESLKAAEKQLADDARRVSLAEVLIVEFAERSV